MLRCATEARDLPYLRKTRPCRLRTHLIVLLYNLWHFYARLYDGEHQKKDYPDKVDVPADGIQWFHDKQIVPD